MFTKQDLEAINSPHFLIRVAQVQEAAAVVHHHQILAMDMGGCHNHHRLQVAQATAQAMARVDILDINHRFNWHHMEDQIMDALQCHHHHRHHMEIQTMDVLQYRRRQPI